MGGFNSRDQVIRCNGVLNCLRVETSWNKAIMGTNQIIFFLTLFIYSCTCASSLTNTSPSVANLQENKARTIVEKSKLSGSGRGMSNGGGGQTEESNNQNPHGSSAVIPIYAANAHHNSHRNAATRPDNNPTIFPPLFFATLLAFLV